MNRKTIIAALAVAFALSGCAAANQETMGGPADGLVWLVAPTLDYETVRQCSCGLFLDQNWHAIDPETGQLTGEYHNGHGGPFPGFVYDAERGLFGHPGYGGGYHTLIGMHPLDTFAEIMADIDPWWSAASFLERTHIVQRVDSSIRTYGEPMYIDGALDDLGWWWLAEEAYLGRFALMHQGAFVTDFIFDEGRQQFRHWDIVTDAAATALRMGSAWGLVGNDGNTVLPFMFENLVIIGHGRAFARYGGYYGILDLSMASFTP